MNDKFLNHKILLKTGLFFKTNNRVNVLIRSNATILPIKIDKDVIIVAGSVVTKNCKKNSVYI